MSTRLRQAVLPNRRLVVGGLASIAAGTLTGCASGPPTPKTTALEFSIAADQEINLNANNDPSPILLRVYELKSRTAFEQATFFELLDGDTTKLGQDLVAKREFEVRPGERSTFNRDAPADARHVGVIAGFRQMDVAQWRSIADIVPDRNNAFLITINALAVKIVLERASRNFGLI